MNMFMLQVARATRSDITIITHDSVLGTRQACELWLELVDIT